LWELRYNMVNFCSANLFGPLVHYSWCLFFNIVKAVCHMCVLTLSDVDLPNLAWWAAMGRGIVLTVQYKTPGHWQTFAALWSYCPQLTTRGPPPCCRCGDPGAASRLEATVRKTQPHLASCSGGRPWPTEHWPSICLEEGSCSWRLAAHCGHSNAPAEYAIKEKKRIQNSTINKVIRGP